FYWKRYYELPVEACKGAYYVTLDKGGEAGIEPIWEGTGDEDWQYIEEEDTGEYPHPPKVVFFNINKEVPKGTGNLVIHYFTKTAPENVVADILVLAGVPTAADLEFEATNIFID
ncbi:unnamed protein product, partial [marine sediment metagenome]